MRSLFIFAFFCTFYSFPAFVKTIEQEFSEIEHSSDNTGIQSSETKQKEEEIFNNLQFLEKESITATPPKVIEKKRFQKTFVPKKFLAILHKDSKIIRLSDQKILIVPKKVIIKAKEIFFGGQYSIIFNKKGEKRYRIETSKLTSIESDLDLYTKIDPKKTYEERTQFHTIDKSLKFENHFVYHIENINTVYLTGLYDTLSEVAVANRFEVKSYFLSFLPVNFGLSFSIQNGSFFDPDKENTVKWNSFYFGPSIKWDFYQGEKLTLNTFLGAESSFNFQTIDDFGKEYSLSSLLFQVGAQAVYQSFLGDFSLGATFRTQQISVESSNTNENRIISSEKGGLTSLAFSLGYKVDFNL